MMRLRRFRPPDPGCRGVPKRSTACRDLGALLLLVGIGGTLGGCERLIDHPPVPAAEGNSAEGSLLEAQPPTVEIGTAAGDEEGIFGRVNDVVLGTDGSVYILDGIALAVSRFLDDGQFAGRIGGSGGGPGDFRAPSSLFFTPEGLLGVVDTALRRISVVDPEDDTRLQVVETIALGIPALDACHLDGSRVFVLTPPGFDTGKGEGMIAEFSEEWDLVRVFGGIDEFEVSAELAEHPAFFRTLRNLRSAGSLHCLPAHGLIVFVPDETPHILAFGITGEVVWRAELPDYVPVRRDVSNGRMSMSADPEVGSWHTTVASFVLDPEALVVTASMVDPATMVAAFQSYLVESRTGAVTRLGSPEQIPVDRSGNTQAWLQSNPFPMVLLSEAQPIVASP
jgi:hypothetical protein